MLNQHLISVVIPTFNRSSMLRNAIASVLGQSYTNFELLIVDDGSTDNTERTVAEFNDKRIQYIKTDKSGRSHARNVGIERSVGNFLVFLDDDDIFLPEKLSNQLKIALENENITFVSGRCSLRDNSENILNDGGLQEESKNQLKRSFIPGVVLMPSLLIKRSNSMILFFEERLDRFEDLDFYRRYVTNENTYFHAEEVAVVYTHSGNALSQSMIFPLLKALKTYRQICGGFHGPNRHGIAQLFNYYSPAIMQMKRFYFQGILLLFQSILASPSLYGIRGPKILLVVTLSVLKRAIRSLATFLFSIDSRVLMSIKFHLIYRFRLFGKSESVSGPGSDLSQTKILISQLNQLINQYNIESIADAPCGDFFWMQKVALDGVDYCGYDIVRPLISQNSSKYANFKFSVLDLTHASVKQSDLIICRDLMVHLPIRQCLEVLDNFKKSGSRFLLITTFPATQVNGELNGQLWRPLNLSLPPFNLGEPLELLFERNTESPLYADKSLGLWVLK